MLVSTTQRKNKSQLERQISQRVPVRIYNGLNELSALTNRSQASLIREALTEYLKNSKIEE